MLHLDEDGLSVEFGTTLTSYGGEIRRDVGPVMTVPIPMNQIAGIRLHRRLLRRAILED